MKVGQKKQKKIQPLYLTEESVEFLRLMALEQNVSMSKVTVDMIETCYEHIPALLQSVGYKIYDNWNKKNWAEFYESANSWLAEKKLSQNHIEKILLAIRERYGKGL